MRRREFITLFGGAAVTWPLAVSAQQTSRLPVVALVFAAAPASDMAGPDPRNTIARAFVHGLRDLGRIDGRNIIIERHTPEGKPERAKVIFDDLARRRVGVIIVAGGRWLQDAAQQATRTVPTVTVFPEDPVASGLISSLARPGGNLTGVTQTTGPEFHSKQLELLKELAPGISRVTFLAEQEFLEQYRAAAIPPGLKIIPIRVEVAEQYGEAFAIVQRERADAMIVGGGPVGHFHLARVAAFAGENNLPTIFAYREAVQVGGLLSYGTSVPGLYRQLARFVTRILGGSRPEDLPTERPTAFELVINLSTARTLGLTVPPMLLARADEVIE